MLPIASPTTKLLPTISVCINAGKDTGSKVSVGVGLAVGDGDSLDVAALVADSSALAQPANKSEPTITRGTKLRFIILKVCDFQGIRRLYLYSTTNSGSIQDCGMNSSTADGISDSEQLKLPRRISR